MNTIPLVKGNTQEEINTSLIALKKALDEMNSSSGKTDASVQSQIKQINELIENINTHLDTVDEQITDLQPVDSVTSGNMQSVTSNAVAQALSYYTTEHKTGEYWIDGKPIYTIVILNPQLATYLLQNVSEIINCIIKRRTETSQDTSFVYYDGNAPANSISVSLSGGGVRLYNISGGWDTVIDWVYLKYTKTTD
jgi:hypothetical protein